MMVHIFLHQTSVLLLPYLFPCTGRRQDRGKKEDAFVKVYVQIESEWLQSETEVGNLIVRNEGIQKDAERSRRWHPPN